MAEGSQFKENSQAVQSHLTILQAVIQRMATNSSSSKAWCITLVSAILVIVADKGKPQFVWFALIPTALFLVLDAYYLGLERGFRNSYNIFIEKLHNQTLLPEDLFVVNPQGKNLKLFCCALCSFSIWPFYGVLAIMIFIAKILVVC